MKKLSLFALTAALALSLAACSSAWCISALASASAWLRCSSRICRASFWAAWMRCLLSAAAASRIRLDSASLSVTF